MFSLRTIEDAHEITEHFNGFHDGFVESLTLRSLDRFVRGGGIGHEVTGAFEVTIVFAHYNYGGALQPHDRRISARFAGVSHFAVDLTERGPESWPIIALGFNPTTDGRFEAEFTWHELKDGAWATNQAVWFQFEDARFEEQNPQTP